MKNKDGQDIVRPIASSFRDPCAQLFKKNGKLYRKINSVGLTDYGQLMSSGLYDKLSELNYLIPHIEIENTINSKIIKPEKVEFISYPYEWSYSQYKDAALLTLEINIIALHYGMILKDASAYNIQFHLGKPILIDTSSFEIYQKDKPWSAYQQFCKHFLVPLSLMSKVDLELGLLMKQYIDGIPLNLASKLLPIKSWCSFFLLIHIHIHSRVQLKYSSSNKNLVDQEKLSKSKLLNLLQHLKDGISSLSHKKVATEWGNYYNNTNYSTKAFNSKLKIINSFLEENKPSFVWDIGSNNGVYSRECSKVGASVISFDIDPLAVDLNYIKTKKDKESLVLPLVQDLTNPSASVGWALTERDSIANRSKKPDMIMALALVHHLAISKNIPLEYIAKYFCSLSDVLLVEFVPKEDSQVKKLLSNRKDIFSTYNIKNFTVEFSKYYSIVKKIKIDDSLRTLFLMKKIN